MEKVTYDVCLSNRETIFDQKTGFETPEEALDWADNRGSVYVIQLSNSRDEVINISANSVYNGMRYMIYTPWDGWQYISREAILDRFR